MLVIDGSQGEGGGQLLRSSLSLSLLTGTPFRIEKLRAGRKRPGLMRQHLICVQAAAEVGSAEVTGAEIGSSELSFRPRGVQGGSFDFSLGSAGSTTLVLQTLLLPLLLAAETPSTLSLTGGTHNPMAPPFEFLEQSFLGVLSSLGGRVRVALERHGFYPAGGGRFTAQIEPTRALERLELVERGPVKVRARALVARVPTSVGLRQLDTLTRAMGWPREVGQPQMIANSLGPGNALLVSLESEHLTEVIVGFGERGVRAEVIAEAVARATRRYLDADVPVGEHLADQLLLPLALGAGGVFRTLAPSLHFRTQAELLEQFLGTQIRTREESPDVWRIEVPELRHVPWDVPWA